MGPFEGLGSPRDEPFGGSFHSLLLVLFLEFLIRIMFSFCVSELYGNLSFFFPTGMILDLSTTTDSLR